MWNSSNRIIGVMRRILGPATGLAVVLVLAQPALAASPRTANTQSTTLAGLDFANYIGVPGAVSAVVVVPKLSCKATPAAGRAIAVGVGIQSVNSYARLDLTCTPGGTARFYASLIVNGTIKNMPSDAARAGDTVEVEVSQSDSITTDSVIDLTHKFIATANGSGSGTSEGVLAGDFPVLSGSTTLGVPSFGTVAFSNALINGYPFGSAVPDLQLDDLYGNSTLQIKTAVTAGKNETFTTVFKHS